jgi:hypothetical protein
MTNTVTPTHEGLTVTDEYNDSLHFEFYDDGSIDVALDTDASISVTLSREDIVSVLDAYNEFLKEHGSVPEGDEVTPTTVFARSGDEEQDWNLDAAASAQNLGLVLSFRYAKSPTAPIESRRLVVENVIEISDGTGLVVGRDPDRDDDTRSFRVDRMKGFATVEKA